MSGDRSEGSLPASWVSCAHEDWGQLVEKDHIIREKKVEGGNSLGKKEVDEGN